MRILLLSQTTLTPTLGGARVVLDLSRELTQLGWNCTLLQPQDLWNRPEPWSRVDIGERFSDYLHEHASEYDVIDYDHEYLPFSRCLYASRPLFVARSVLLAQHLETIAIPRATGWRALFGSAVKGASRRAEMLERVRRAERCVEEADLVNVANDDDRAELLRRGVPPEKIVVLPFGLSRERRGELESVDASPPARPTVVFVGTFDYRKGAREFPSIVASIAQRVPEARFRLLGCKGYFRTQSEILAQFPLSLRERIEVRMQYEPAQLPSLLSGCSVGVFPSHMEGFPFGVLEMLAAAVPVVGYRAPGSPMMLEDKCLVARGDHAGMAQKVVDLLRDPARLVQMRAAARSRSRQFDWPAIALRTSQIYRDRIARRTRLPSTAAIVPASRDDADVAAVAH